MDDIQFNYFDIEHAIRVHDWIIEKTGGLHGIRDQGVLVPLSISKTTGITPGL